MSKIPGLSTPKDLLSHPIDLLTKGFSSLFVLYEIARKRKRAFVLELFFENGKIPMGNAPFDCQVDVRSRLKIPFRSGSKDAYPFDRRYFGKSKKAIRSFSWKFLWFRKQSKDTISE